MRSRQKLLLALTAAFFGALVVPAVVVATTAFAPSFANETFGTTGIVIAVALFTAGIVLIVGYGDRLRAMLAKSTD